MFSAFGTQQPEAEEVVDSEPAECAESYPDEVFDLMDIVEHQSMGLSELSESLEVLTPIEVIDQDPQDAGCSRYFLFQLILIKFKDSA